jgi:hypothetical protein
LRSSGSFARSRDFLFTLLEVGPLGWDTTVFFDAFCLLSAIGLFSNHAPNIIRPFGCTAIGWIALAHFG